MTPQDLGLLFPKDFTFGVATAAFQIEGAATQDGRGPSIWDAFSKMPGRVLNGDTGDVACDHYNRLDEDLDLIAALGVDAYRFSIAWPRVQPYGEGAPRASGLDFYDRLVDGLVARGIKVFPTLYHWDLPLALMAHGGWTNRSIADRFAEYAVQVVRRLGDRTDALATFNEPWCMAHLGHLQGVHAPGERNMDAFLHAVHGINLAHGTAVQAMRAERSDLSLGVVLNALSTYPASDAPEDVAAAERFWQFNNDVFFGPMFAGAYGDQFLAAYGERMPLRAGDLETIHQPLDWWGLNYYCPETVRHDPNPKAAFPAVISVPSTTSNVRTDIGWEIKSEGLTHVLKTAYARYDLPPCYITENGACYNMGPDADGVVDDAPRVAYLVDHIGRVAEAVAEGIPLRGYFAWSLMDNFEWALGYEMRFGLVHVDYATQTRTVKASGQWFAELCAAPRGT